MLLKNAKIFDKNFDIIDADILIKGEKLDKICWHLESTDETVYDLSSCTILPGFIDQHTHGCAGYDTCDASFEAIEAMSMHMAQNGVTSFCPTTMTLSENKLSDILACIKESIERGLPGAYIQGINMEGPFINLEKKAAQNGEFIVAPDYKMFKRLNEKSGGIVKLIDIAPECEGADEFIKSASKDCVVSLAHTNATYEQVMHAFNLGAGNVTHLFNAMTGFNHRAPGVVGAAFDSKTAKAEIICDGIHIKPACLRTAFKVLGEDRSIIISDSMSAAGCKDGEYELGGQKVYVKNNVATLKSGVIAGSTTNLFDEFINVLEYGIPLKQALKSLTINPAKQLDADKITGSIEIGKNADLLVINNNLEIIMVIVRGCVVVNNL